MPYIGDKQEKFIIRSIIDCGGKLGYERGVSSDTLLRKIKDKISIFQTLYSYIYRNTPIIMNFLNKLNNEILFFYFIVYYKKKFIYIRYLEIFKKVLQQKNISYNSWISEKESNPSNKNNNHKNNNNKNKNQIENHSESNIQNHENETNHYASLNQNQISKVKEIELKIKRLQDKKRELDQNRNQPNFDKKILLIEKYIHELILEKRKIYM